MIYYLKRNFIICIEEDIMTKPEITKILLTLPEDLTNQLREEADMQYRSLNNYILWLLVNRDRNKTE